jgi:hypothetical protein
LESDYQRLKAEAVRVANEVRETLTGDFREIEDLIVHHDIVVAIWQDSTEPDGVGMLVIKGQQRLREISTDEPQKVSFTAIPCIEFEQAEALRQRAGERDKRH